MSPFLVLPVPSPPVQQECRYDKNGFGFESDLAVEYYDIPGGNIGLVLEMLHAGPKPFATLGPDTVGAHETQWSVSYSYRLDDAQRLDKVCFVVDYTIHLPRFEDPAIARCLRNLVDATRRHEERHHDLTRPLVELGAPKLLGMRKDEVDGFLADLERRITRANTLFHDSPAGQPVLLGADMLGACPR